MKYYRYVYAQNFINNDLSSWVNEDGSLKKGIILVTTKEANAGLPHDSLDGVNGNENFVIPIWQDIIYNGQKIGDRRIVGAIDGIYLAKVLKITVNGVEYMRNAVFAITE